MVAQAVQDEENTDSLLKSSQGDTALWPPQLLLPAFDILRSLQKMEVLLGVKIGCLLALLVLTLGCGLTPIYVKWFQMDAATGRAAPLCLCPSHQVFSQTCPDICLWFSHIPPKTLGAVCCPSFIPTCLFANWRITLAFFNRPSPQGSEPPGLQLCRCLPGSRVDAYDC